MKHTNPDTTNTQTKPEAETPAKAAMRTGAGTRTRPANRRSAWEPRFTGNPPRAY
ncbi:MAG: hypothetical protein LBG82_07105 [Clostridiales Family XIII bacterium]|nr:hypothetical protein [Clostridiales Family XIII bacterium]